MNDAEREMSEKIRKMIVDVADALIKSDPLSKNVEGFMGDGWLMISSIYRCLIMLGQDVPLELVNQLRGLIDGCMQFSEKNREISRLQYSFKCRFG
jgi:hypothetical protein